MYAKILMPTNVGDVPGVLVATPDFDRLRTLLLPLGWGEGDESESRGPKGNISITPEGFSLYTSDTILLTDEVSSVSPSGWWEAVSAWGDTCTVLFVAADALDFTAGDIGEQLVAALDQHRVLSATLPVNS